MYMFAELGELFGWLLIISFTGTILNYVLKYINKRYGKKITSNPRGKKVIKVFMTVFVRNHKYFGLATVLFILAHFVTQFTRFGLNITGGIAAAVMICQVALGFLAHMKKWPRKGAWFILHRAIAVILIAGIATHLMIPYGFNGLSGGSENSGADVSVNDGQIFTMEELATYNGENGNKSYVAYNGHVYDVTDHP